MRKGDIKKIIFRGIRNEMTEIGVVLDVEYQGLQKIYHIFTVKAEHRYIPEENVIQSTFTKKISPDVRVLLKDYYRTYTKIQEENRRYLKIVNPLLEALKEISDTKLKKIK